MAPEEVRAQSDADELPSVDRLLALSDGVVAIALTLLVLQLDGSGLRSDLSVHGLASAISGRGDQFAAYLTSFYVVAQFWLVHHRVFRMMRGHDEGLAWWNFLFLFTITLMPFTSELIGKEGGNPLADTIFIANLLLASLSTQIVALYGRRRHLFLADVPEEELLLGRDRGIAISVVLGLAIALSWLWPGTALFILLALIVLPRIFMAWRAGRRAEATRLAEAAHPDPGS